MTAAISAAALLVVAAAILAAAVVLGRTRSVRQALPVFLDLLTAAGLLRLLVGASWSRIGGSGHALLLVVSTLPSLGVRGNVPRRRACHTLRVPTRRDATP